MRLIVILRLIVARKVSGIFPIVDNNKILLISTDKGHFVFPKGGVKRHEASVQAARREANEEAGISGTTDSEPFTVEKGINFHRMYVDYFDDNYLEDKVRTRIIVTPEQALNNKDVPDYVKDIIHKAISLKYIE